MTRPSSLNGKIRAFFSARGIRPSILLLFLLKICLLYFFLYQSPKDLKLSIIPTADAIVCVFCSLLRAREEKKKGQKKIFCITPDKNPYSCSPTNELVLPGFVHEMQDSHSVCVLRTSLLV